MEESNLIDLINTLKTQLGYDRIENQYAKRWIDAFASENTAKPKLIITVLEKMLEKNLSIEDFFLCYIYAGSDNIASVFEFSELVIAQVASRRPLVKDDFKSVPWGSSPNYNCLFKRKLTELSLVNFRYNPSVDGTNLRETVKNLPLDNLNKLILKVRESLRYGELDLAARAFWDDVHKLVQSKRFSVDYYLFMLFLQENNILLDEFYLGYTSSKLNNIEEIVFRIKQLKERKGHSLAPTDYFEIDGFVVV